MACVSHLLEYLSLSYVQLTYPLPYSPKCLRVPS